MAAVSCVLVEDQFLCSICLEVFTDPVTTSCGHNFCKSCIYKHWDISGQHNCPICKKVFRSRPRLKVNTVVAEMVFEFKNNPPIEDIEVRTQAAGAGDICCDVCSEPKLKALKSCLVCLMSYCQSHLQPHHTIPRLKGHQLIPALENLEDRICSQHHRPQELFCRNDSKFICLQCTIKEHRDHEAVPIKEEFEVQQTEVRQMIQDRRRKIQEIQRLVEDSQANADREIKEGLEVYNDLMKCIQQSLEQFKQRIKEKHKKTEEEAAEWIEKLKSEICLLEKRRAEMDLHWSSEDHFHFVQTFTSVKPAPAVNDWSKVTVPVTYEGILAKAVSIMHDKELSREIRKVFVAEMKRLQKFAVKISLDKDSAHPNLDLLFNLTFVQKKNTPNFAENSQRCTHFVLARQTFSSGKFYFQVLVKGLKDWAIGVASVSTRTREDLDLRPCHGFWVMEWNNENVWPCTVGGSEVKLKIMPYRIGVFVDCGEGLVSFYDVTKAELIHSLTNCSFTENLLPMLSPGNRYGALQIDNLV